MKHYITLFLLLLTTVMTHAQSFMILGDSAFYAHDISPDGKYVVGQVGLGTAAGGHHTFVWTKEDGIREWDEEKTNVLREGSTARAVSSTGRIAGIAPDSNRIVPTTEGLELPYITAAFRDYESDNWTFLPLTTDRPLFYGFFSLPYAISADGNRIVGGQTPGSQSQHLSAGYWDVSDPDNVVYHALPIDASTRNSDARAVSGDGKVIGGHEDERVTLWIDAEGNGNYTKTTVNNVSTDVVRGISDNGKYAVFRNNLHAALYDIEKEELADFDQGNTFSIPTAVSDKGVVVGYWRHARSNLTFYERAFIYSKTLGMVNFETFLSENGIAFAMDSILAATGISADGRKVTGYGMRQGKTVSFYAEIPEISDKFIPVKNASIHSPTYGTVVLKWGKPDENKESNPSALTGYALYQEGLLVASMTHPEDTSYTVSNVADGTYRYTVKAVYNDNGASVESINSKTLVITMGKKTLPFFDDFSSYQPGGAVFEYMEILEEIPLSLGYWDVTANTVSYANAWKVNQYGHLPWCAGFLDPGGSKYDESLISPYFDARNMEDLLLSFEVQIPQSILPKPDSDDRMTIEIYDGSEWLPVDNIPINSGNSFFMSKAYPVNELAGKDNIRFRFRCSGSGAANSYWLIDNVELTDSAHMVTIEPPLVVSAREAKEEGSVHIQWVDPQGNVSLRYLLFDNATGRLANDKYPMIAANMYPAEDLKAYDGYYLSSISFWRTTTPEQVSISLPQYQWFVSQGGVRLLDEEVVDPQLGWNTIQLADPIRIDASQPLYYGVEIVECDPLDAPIGSATYYIPLLDKPNVYQDTDIADGRGNIYSEDDGKTWQKVSDVPGFSYDLYCIRATLSKEPVATPAKRILGYKIFRNEENVLDSIWGNNSTIVLNNYTDVHPLPAGENVCYTVKTYYAYYTGTILSGGTSDCIIINGIVPVENERGIKIYPNPIRKNETIRIELSTTEYPTGARIQIHTVSGKKVRELRTQTSVVPLQLNVEAGVYLLTVNDKESVRLVVE